MREISLGMNRRGIAAKKFMRQRALSDFLMVYGVDPLLWIITRSFLICWLPFVSPSFARGTRTSSVIINESNTEHLNKIQAYFFPFPRQRYLEKSDHFQSSRRERLVRGNRRRDTEISISLLSVAVALSWRVIPRGLRISQCDRFSKRRKLRSDSQWLPVILHCKLSKSWQNGRLSLEEKGARTLLVVICFPTRISNTG